MILAAGVNVPSLGRDVIVALVSLFIVLWIGKLLFELLRHPIKARTELMLVIACVWFGYMLRPSIQAEGVWWGSVLFVLQTALRVFLIVLAALGVPVQIRDLLPR